MVFKISVAFEPVVHCCATAKKFLRFTYFTYFTYNDISVTQLPTFIKRTIRDECAEKKAIRIKFHQTVNDAVVG